MQYGSSLVGNFIAAVFLDKMASFVAAEELIHNFPRS